MPLDLSKRELMSMEFAKSILESPHYFDEEVLKKSGLEARQVAREAIQVADALIEQLEEQDVGSVLIENKNGETVPVSPEVVNEAKRLVEDDNEDEAIEHVMSQTGANKKKSREFVAKHCS